MESNYVLFCIILLKKKKKRWGNEMPYIYLGKNVLCTKDKHEFLYISTLFPSVNSAVYSLFVSNCIEAHISRNNWAKN